MRQGSIALAALTALLVLAPARLLAQDAPPPDEPGDGTVASQDADVARRAREEFEQGFAHFEARRFREAIHSFQVAAQLVPSADLWFNIARAHEELGEWEQAIEHYRRYLELATPGAIDRDDVRRHLIDLGVTP